MNSKIYNLFVTLVGIVVLVLFLISLDVYKYFPRFINFNIISSYTKLETSEKTTYTIIVPGCNKNDITAKIVNDTLFLTYNEDKLNNVNITHILKNVVLTQNIDKSSIIITVNNGIVSVTMNKIHPKVIDIHIGE
jgi:HSP20 family molecular chaperone IbpA